MPLQTNSNLRKKKIVRSHSKNQKSVNIRKKYRARLQKINICSSFQEQMNEYLPFLLKEYEFYFSRIEREKQIQIHNLMNDGERNPRIILEFVIQY